MPYNPSLEPWSIVTLTNVPTPGAGAEHENQTFLPSIDLPNASPAVCTARTSTSTHLPVSAWLLCSLRPWTILSKAECRSSMIAGGTLSCILDDGVPGLSLIHISEPTRLGMISYAVFCLK